MINYGNGYMYQDKPKGGFMILKSLKSNAISSFGDTTNCTMSRNLLLFL